MTEDNQVKKVPTQRESFLSGLNYTASAVAGIAVLCAVSPVEWDTAGILRAALAVFVGGYMIDEFRRDWVRWKARDKK